MSKLVEINFNPDTKTLRQFGVIAFVGFGILAALAYYEKLIFSFGLGEARMPLVMTFAALGTIAALFSLVAPRANRVLYVGLTLLAFPIGFVLSYVIMGTLFFLIIGPIALLFRLSGRTDAPGLRAGARPPIGWRRPRTRQRELLPSVLRGGHVGR